MGGGVSKGIGCLRRETTIALATHYPDSLHRAAVKDLCTSPNHRKHPPDKEPAKEQVEHKDSLGILMVPQKGDDRRNEIHDQSDNPQAYEKNHTDDSTRIAVGLWIR